MTAAFKGYIRFLGKFGCVGIRRYEPMKQTNAIITTDAAQIARLIDVINYWFRKGIHTQYIRK